MHHIVQCNNYGRKTDRLRVTTMAAFDPIPVVIPPDGAVDIRDKLQPICETSGPYPPLAYTRGMFDITEWKKKLASIASGPEWHEHDNATSSSVKIARAAHDAWGIHKIIFTFCDDFLLKVIDLPNSRNPEWKRLLDPVYAQMGIPPERVVRALLARMPAGVQIPVHHDTGYWVKHTHRCHIALETSDLVDFMVGPTADAMQKVRSYYNACDADAWVVLAILRKHMK